MQQFGGKDSKRHFTVVMGDKEHGLYVSSTPSSAARKAVTKLCTANKSKKVEFHIREITQGSKKKTYGPYSGYIEKLKEPIELKGRVIQYKPVVKLSGKTSAKKGGNGSDANNVDPITHTFNNLSNIPLGRNNAPYPEPSNREKQKIQGHERKEYMQDAWKKTAERTNKKKINQRIFHNLNDIAYNLKKEGKITNYDFLNKTKDHPVFFVLHTTASSLPKYFLTYVNGYYVAFHVTNPESDNRGDVFAGITKDFEKFKEEVLDENFNSFKKKFFYDYHGSDPNARLSAYNITQNSSINFLIVLKRDKGKIYPTYKIETIETNGNTSSTSLFT